MVELGALETSPAKPTRGVGQSRYVKLQAPAKYTFSSVGGARLL